LNFFISREQSDKGKLVPQKATTQAAMNLEREIDRTVLQQFRCLEETVKAPVLDSLQGNYTTSFFSQNKMPSSFVTVRKLDALTDDLASLKNFEGNEVNLRISKLSNFYTLWKSVCSYWVLPLNIHRECI